MTTAGRPRDVTARQGALPDIQMPSLLVGRVIAFVRERGGDADRLITDYGLPPTVETDPMTVLPLSRLHAFLDEAARAINDPFLGVHVSERGGRDAANLLEFVCRGATSLRGALDRYLRFVATLNEALIITFESTDDGALVRARVPGNTACLGRHGNEHWVVAVLAAASRVTGAPCVPERVWFAHPKPRSVGELTLALGTTHLEFGADANTIFLRAELLDAPIVPGAAPLSAVLDRYTELAPAGPPRVSHFHGRLCEAIRSRLPKGEPSLAVIARALGVSARTLQRRLSEDALTFESVVNAVREDLAKLYVQQGELSIDEIAGRLGYAQRSAFLRAFKRWTGTTPKQMRSSTA